MCSTPSAGSTVSTTCIGSRRSSARRARQCRAVPREGDEWSPVAGIVSEELHRVPGEQLHRVVDRHLAALRVIQEIQEREIGSDDPDPTDEHDSLFRRSSGPVPHARSLTPRRSRTTRGCQRDLLRRTSARMHPDR
ncbi:hypothetical protein PSCLAVI8L_130275 [Pseudoclavibacter sp. 8L]|nr:hypothetical protein PSCLAVI8L_130275 [Pseudoclavibacter sp. 8L]